MGEPEYSRRHLTCLRAGEHPHTDVWLGLIEVVVLRQGWQAQNFGEVSERFKEHAWKVCVRPKAYRGFESLPLRQSNRNGAFGPISI